MSQGFTEITEEIYSYINDKFTNEDLFLNNLQNEAASLGIPDISISPQQASFLGFILKVINAKYVLEIGTLAGYSAISMARELPSNGKLITVEIEKERVEFVRRKAKEDGLENIIEVINSDAVEFFKNYKPSFKFDLIFVDADKQGYVDYLSNSLQLLRKGGIFAADNALAFGEIAKKNLDEREPEVTAVRKFNDVFASNPNLKSSLVTIGDGLAIGVKL
ncbi:MAG: O-methyltransferase [Ignavibacteriae bacterium]|nr:O-methyltransferase [Ignavibacteriota bacterium]